MKKKIDAVIRRHIYGAMAVGLIPVPFIDFVGVGIIELDLTKKLAEIYNVPFSKDMVKNFIAALLGGAAPASAGPIFASMIKAVPIIGHSVGAVSMSAFSGASVYAIGKVFNRHFAEGGTFLTFDPEKAKTFYAQMFKEGKTVASELKAEKKQATDKQSA